MSGKLDPTVRESLSSRARMALILADVAYRSPARRLFALPYLRRMVEDAIKFVYFPGENRSQKTHVVEVVGNSGARFLAHTDNYIEWWLFVRGSYEQEITDLLTHSTPKGGVFIDCGANVGVHTCAVARSIGVKGTVIAVEPVVEVLERLKKNIEINQLSNVRLVDAAVSDHTGEATIHVIDVKRGNLGTASLETLDTEEVQKSAVTLTTIDEIVRDLAVSRVDVIKLDIQGHELEALRGAKETISRFFPMIVYEDECHLRQDVHSHSDLAGNLESAFGYSVESMGRSMYVATRNTHRVPRL